MEAVLGALQIPELTGAPGWDSNASCAPTAARRPRATAYLASEVVSGPGGKGFGVTDRAVLPAVACHTTLKAGANCLDKGLYVADKLAWDQPGKPPYFTKMLAGLKRSVDDACRVYLRYL